MYFALRIEKCSMTKHLKVKFKKLNLDMSL